jgi:protein-tyrosine phosphatase
VTGKGARRLGVRRIMKSAYRATRNLPDRILYLRRHRDAKRRLSMGRRPRTILVVCHANLCRSPYLEAVLQRALPDVAVVSAGFIGSDRPAPKMAVTLSAKRGLDLSRHRSRPLGPSFIGKADLILVMDAEQAREIETLFPGNRAPVVIAGDLDIRFEGTRFIQDPWNQSSDVFESSFDRLDRCAAMLVSLLQRSK